MSVTAFRSPSYAEHSRFPTAEAREKGSAPVRNDGYAVADGAPHAVARTLQAVPLRMLPWSCRLRRVECLRSHLRSLLHTAMMLLMMAAASSTNPDVQSISNLRKRRADAARCDRTASRPNGARSEAAYSGLRPYGVASSAA